MMMIQGYGAIYWKGVSGRGDDCCPSNEEFKDHFEHVLNLPDIVDPHHIDFYTDVSWTTPSHSQKSMNKVKS